MDWIRKHLFDLTNLCRDCKENPALTTSQREVFAETYLTTALYSSLPRAGGTRNVAVAVTKLCDACQSIIHRECPGRSDWKQTCQLLHEHMSR